MEVRPRMPFAALRVLNLPELLETILLNLSMKDLILSQRVCSSFRDTIQSSIQLRRKLFLEPDWHPERRTEESGRGLNRPGPKPNNNSLLLRAFPGYYPTITLVIITDGANGGQTSFATGRGAAVEEWSWDVRMSFPADKKPYMKEAVAYPDASWRKMYLSQPPCKSLYLRRRWQRSIKPAMIREGGITMGDFFTEVTRDNPGCGDRAWHQSYISSDRDWHFEGNVKSSSVEM